MKEGLEKINDKLIFITQWGDVIKNWTYLIYNVQQEEDRNHKGIKGRL